MQLTATAMDNKGNAVPNQSFLWPSSNNGNATVSRMVSSPGGGPGT